MVHCLMCGRVLYASTVCKMINVPGRHESEVNMSESDDEQIDRVDDLTVTSSFTFYMYLHR